MSIETSTPREKIHSRGWTVVESCKQLFAQRGAQTTPYRLTIEAVLEDVERIGCHGLPGILGPNGDRGKLTLKTDYSCNSVSSKGPFAEGAGATLDWYEDFLQVLVYDQQDDPALHVRMNQDGTIAEIVMRDKEMGRLITFEGEPREPSQWEKARDGI